MHRAQIIPEESLDNLFHKKRQKEKARKEERNEKKFSKENVSKACNGSALELSLNYFVCDQNFREIERALFIHKQ